jgi:antitoxin component HigA of HigAB toxin-antitoxin module
MAELLDFTKPHVLRNEAEYTAAVAEIDQLLDLDPPPHAEA